MFYLMLQKDKMVGEHLDVQIELTQIIILVTIIIIVRTVYSGIFRHIQKHSAIFSQVQAY